MSEPSDPDPRDAAGSATSETADDRTQLERATDLQSHQRRLAEREPGLLGRWLARMLRVAPASQLELNDCALEEQRQSLTRQDEMLARIHDLVGHAATVDGRLKELEEREQHLHAQSQELQTLTRQIRDKADETELRSNQHWQNVLTIKDELKEGLLRLEHSAADRMTKTEANFAQQITELSARNGNEIGKEIERLSDPVRELVAATVKRIEIIEAHLPALTNDLVTDIGTLRASALAQGRQLDDIAGELVAASLEIQEMRDDTQTMDRQFGELSDAVERKLNPNAQFDHFDFARRYRGDSEQLDQQLRSYARIFGPVKRVLDFGCGRGEFLAVCREIGIGAYGVDSDPEMISHCNLQDLEVAQGDALVHLRKLDDRSLDGIFSAQVVEHLTPKELVEFVALAARKLKRGGVFIAETINPNTWSALRWYHLDPTHVQPVPPDMLRFFLEEQDFEIRDVLHCSPVPEKERLALLTGAPGVDPKLAQAIDANTELLNRALFGFQDYAIVAER